MSVYTYIVEVNSSLFTTLLVEQPNFNAYCINAKTGYCNLLYIDFTYQDKISLGLHKESEDVV